MGTRVFCMHKLPVRLRLLPHFLFKHIFLLQKMLFQVRTNFPTNLYLDLYMYDKDLFFKSSRFSFWFYSTSLQENYYFFFANKLLSLQTFFSKDISLTTTKNIIFSVAKASAFKWRFHFQITGLGFKVLTLNDSYSEFSLGFSHNVSYTLKENVFVLRTTKNKQTFKVFGFDLAACVLLVGMLKRLKSPDIYKGKGLKFYRERLKLRKREKFSR